ncbi:class I SAM-dependent methyltransferase [Ancylobacter sp. 6x-1]|uniref:Class I SAM-dependent methyltransferase n=1 Tax=Ancylobacter crimeensis TaxID=2579147 RepID=A0ABT0DDN2_9HYPH|nr:class I SAM-dependent methyltransferase [Ancylobacter crimeensis]MCK0198065.1 class I SAM-dependent methyltransferase [Ancylobacter crimeensis]
MARSSKAAVSAAGARVIAMRGAGYYSSNTAGAKQVIDSAAELALSAIAGMALPADGRPFAIADYGAADGGTSLDMMRRLVGAVRARDGGLPVSLTYTDLPSNDFSALFSLLQAEGGEGREGGLGREPGVFVFGSGTSFYRQILPDATLHLGFSATAMHWLSRSPGPIAGHTHAVGAAPEERAAYRAQSLADWDTILLARARELVPGGVLVMANFCVDENGHYLGWTGGVNMHDRFAAHWRALQDEGTITEAEHRAAALQQYYKTAEEFAAPFRDPASAVSLAGLRLERVFTRVTPCPYRAAFEQHGDAASFARSYIPTLRSWTESTFLSALDPARGPERRRAIVDRFYDLYEAEVAASPAGHAMDYVHCFMVIRKV